MVLKSENTSKEGLVSQLVTNILERQWREQGGNIVGEQERRDRRLPRMIKNIFLRLGMRLEVCFFFIKSLVKMHYIGMYKLGQTCCFSA